MKIVLLIAATVTVGLSACQASRDVQAASTGPLPANPEVTAMIQRLDAQVNQHAACRAYLDDHAACPAAQGDGAEDDATPRRTLHLQAMHAQGEALGVYCRDVHAAWKQQWAGSCPL
ncbi:hypothetical protein [Stenotrophomonas sp. 24(2023)]|uniref:hypothetical protein n=1 Tax=Stenotrophomonas sp. 24(2023) TaxID=3068324 RepID=UPI0027DFD4C6|nr:hypothetical protein [Stenotrophomonas sp. 24(2023)]WMJ67804.1 hypothetical protein Q9R17_11290 [Stenotrophomonas sp. 24(2023)]